MSEMEMEMEIWDSIQYLEDSTLNQRQIWRVRDQLDKLLINALSRHSLWLLSKLICSKIRFASVVAIRASVANHLRERYRKSLPEIGRIINRDHSTVIHLLKGIKYYQQVCQIDYNYLTEICEYLLLTDISNICATN